MPAKKKSDVAPKKQPAAKKELTKRSASRASDEAIERVDIEVSTKWQRVRAKAKATESLRATRKTWVDVAALKHTGEKINSSYIHEPDGEKIIFRGIRTHNLKDIDITIPKWQIIAVAGVSWSWKSSFAFDTVYKEGQYRYIE